MRPLFLAVPLAIAACATPVPPDALPDAAEDGVSVIKSPLDGREYAYVELDNGMRGLVISDPDTDMAAASLAVHVGHYADPVDREGLAHFLEHMLFMGTDRYPEVDEYRSFVQDHGGSTNAGTGGEYTRYHFSIDQDALQPAFERFARFFVAPNLDPAYVERERNAVNSEYRLKIRDDYRRGREVRKSTMNQAHPESKFSVGNLDTLADRDGKPVYEDLRALYDAEYRPDRMTVVVLGREPVQELADLVRANLSEVRGEPVAEAPRPAPFTADQLGVRVDVVPLVEKYELELEFPLPPEQPLWPQRPYSYISAALGHEGEGTLFAALKGAGWIEGLSAYAGGPAEDYTPLRITLDLTPEGAAHADEAVAAVFATIEKMREAGVEAWREDEQRTLDELAFRYREEIPPVNAVLSTVTALQDYPPEHALDYWAYHEPLDEALITDALALLTVDNVRVIATLPGAATDQVEALYDVPYGMRKLTDAERAAYTGGTDLPVGLPAANPYLPEDTSLIAGADNPGLPALLSSDGDRLELWALPDTSFGVPRAHTSVQLYSPAPRADGLRSQVTAALYEAVLDDSIEEFRYPLRQAGLSVNLSADDEGLAVQISGYSDRQDVLLRDLAARIRDLQVDPERYAIVQDSLVRRWRNLPLERPINLASMAMGEAFDPHRYDAAAAADLAASIPAADVQAFAATLLDGASATMLVHGNLTEDDARALGATVSEVLLSTGEPAARPDKVVRLIPGGVQVTRSLALDHDDSALIVSYQGQSADPATHAKWMLLGSLVQTPFFTELRTHQQLGYVVYAGYGRTDDLPSLRMGIQSSVAGPDTLLERVDAFVADHRAELDAMDPAAFGTVRDGLIAELTEAPTLLERRHRDLVNEFFLDAQPAFDWEDRVVEALKALTVQDMRAFYADVLLDDPGRVVVRQVGHAHEADAPQVDACADTACVAALLPDTKTRPN